MKGVQAESAQPSSRGLHSGAIDGGMAQPLDSSRAGTLGALGATAGGVAAAGASGQPAASQPSRKAAAEGWQQAEETGKLLAAGGVAGAVSKSATAPLARLTILYQVCCEEIAVPRTYIHCASATAVHDGSCSIKCEHSLALADASAVCT